jgi:hypothetical protein
MRGGISLLLTTLRRLPLTLPRLTMKHGTNREPRTLILCFDGTADEFDDDVRLIENIPGDYSNMTDRTLMWSNSSVC